MNTNEYRAYAISELNRVGWVRSDREISAIVSAAEHEADLTGDWPSALEVANQVEARRQTSRADDRNLV